MDIAFSFLLLYAIAGFVSANQKCHGKPPTYNGKNCASTTLYADFHKGACGCGPDDSDNQYSWNRAGFSAAANQLFFDENGGIWCGQNCGKCIRLTTTGVYINVTGGPNPEDRSKVFMVTNLCPSEDQNTDWCGQTRTHQANNFGYGWHFDLENGVGQIDSLGWNNPEVTWEWADCDQGHREDSRTPSHGSYKQCFCGKQ